MLAFKPCHHWPMLTRASQITAVKHATRMAAALLRSGRWSWVSKRHKTLTSPVWATGSQAKKAARDNSAPETDTGPKLRVNEQITAPFVRLVSEGGHQVYECRCDAASGAIWEDIRTFHA